MRQKFKEVTCDLHPLETRPFPILSDSSLLETGKTTEKSSRYNVDTMIRLDKQYTFSHTKLLTTTSGTSIISLS